MLVFLFPPLLSNGGIESWQKGITLRLRSQPKADIDAELLIISRNGADYLTITPGWVTDSTSSSNVDRKTNTPPDDILAYAIDKAHELGIRVMLKPHLDLKDLSRWRANIDPSNKALFFQNYKAMILHYADLGQAHKVEQFAIGAELFKLSTNKANESYWRDIISEIRKRYSGKLTYSAVFGGGYDELNLIPFWDALDSVGLSAYVPLADNTNPSVESLKTSWSEIEQKYVYPAYLKFNKPILVTEVGWKSIDGAAIQPEGSYSDSLDLQEQSDLYQAFFEFWGLKNYFSGVHFWDWWPEPNRGGVEDKDFTPQDKPAESIIKKFFGGILSPPPSQTENLRAVIVANGLDQPAVLANLPDGRIFIGEKASGEIKIFKNGGLIAEPFFDIRDFIRPGTYFDSYSERGLLGLTFHPDFATDGTKQFIYIYYTLCKSPKAGGTPGTSSGCETNGAKNRVSRFRVNGDSVDTTIPETVIIDDIDSAMGHHNAGWIGFGPDKKLYVAVGDGGGSENRINSQKTTNLNGKILRINDDGSVPPDNPWSTEMDYVSLTLNPIGTSKRREIWAMGFRNPWRCRFSPAGELFCADVGEKEQEEIDIIERGGNYGWPYAEGTTCPSAYSLPSGFCPSGLTPPVYSYGRSIGGSIIGGDFGSRANFSGEHRQSYFFGDFVGSWVKSVLLDSSGIPVPGSLKNIVSGIGRITDLIAGPSGDLYFVDIAAGKLGKIEKDLSGITPTPAPTPTPTPTPEPTETSDPTQPLLIFSPPDNSTISGEKKLKIYIEDRDPETYIAAYNVDGKGEILMENAKPNFKQSVIQFDSWIWNGDGPYNILFTARDLNGKLINTASLTLFVKH